MGMENHLEREVAKRLAQQFTHLIGTSMPYPYQECDITSITVEKDKHGTGFSVILSHDAFANGTPKESISMCPKVDLITYLSIPQYL